MQNFFFSAFVVIGSIQISAGQSIRAHGLSRQMNISTDNDFFLITDRYYTFGMDIEFNSLVKPSSKLFKRIARDSDSSKIRWNYHYGNKIFTPSNIDTHRTEFMDRPYAGWNFLSAGMTIYNKRYAGHDFGIEAGLVGKVSGMGQFQQWWHKVVNTYSVEGWESEIANEVVVNFNYRYTRNWEIARWVDFVSVTQVTTGTGANKLGQEVNFRLLKFNPINNSAFTNSRLTWAEKARLNDVKQEAFFFVGFGGEFVASNIFIEGSLFNNNSVYTLDAKNIVFTSRAGFTYSRQVLNYSLTWFHVGKETRDAKKGNYLSLAMSIRF